MYGEYADLGALGPIVAAVTGTYALFVGIFGILMLVSTCFLMKKAGENWWAALIPIYNTIVLLRMADKAWWWIFLLCIPGVNAILAIIWMVDLLRNFGKSGGHVLLLMFFGVIYWPYLAFSNGVVFKEGQNNVEAAA